MRVIAGSAGGRKLRCLDGRRVRPTQDRVKEAVFSSLMPRIADSRVLDLFAGSGALGIEALSRGAGSAVFVEIDREACELIKGNLAACGWPPSGEAQVVQYDATSWLGVQAGAGRRFDIIFADSPYNKGFEEKVVALIAEGDLLAADGVLALESGARQELPESRGCLYLEKGKIYGDTKISYYTRR